LRRPLVVRSERLETGAETLAGMECEREVEGLERID
jgi:hypothetical protein